MIGEHTESRIFTATLQPANLSFEAPADLPLMQAARRVGINMPASCRNGTCRTCMCRLLGGSITYRIEWPGLLAEEKVEGYILPCVAHAASDVVIETAGPIVIDGRQA